MTITTAHEPSDMRCRYCGGRTMQTSCPGIKPPFGGGCVLVSGALDAEAEKALAEPGRIEFRASQYTVDPWAHRSQRMRCATCMYFVVKANQGDVPQENGKLGRCRRYAPRPEGGGWPAVFEADWCGDHKLDEAKL